MYFFSLLVWIYNIYIKNWYNDNPELRVTNRFLFAFLQVWKMLCNLIPMLWTTPTYAEYTKTSYLTSKREHLAYFHLSCKSTVTREQMVVLKIKCYIIRQFRKVLCISLHRTLQTRHMYLGPKYSLMHYLNLVNNVSNSFHISIPNVKRLL